MKTNGFRRGLCIIACCVLALKEWYGLWMAVVIGDTLQLRVVLYHQFLNKLIT